MINPQEYENKEKYIEELGSSYSLTDPNFITLSLIKNNSKVLSLGCGTGREIQFLIKERNCIVTAVEISKKIIDLAISKEPLAEYLNINMLNFSSSQKYDYVICLYNTINYLNKDERKRLIQICYDNLSETGKLLITTENAYSRIGALKVWLSLNNYYYLPSQIKSWFENSDFYIDIIRVGTFNLIVANKDLTIKLNTQGGKT